MKRIFRKFSSLISAWTGTAMAFVFAVLMVVVWAVCGPLFNYSDTWQLFINTCTTVVTFLMVFLIQNTQNRDGKAMQLKLDELIRTSRPARAEFFGLEDLTDEELAVIDNEFKALHEKLSPSPVMHKLHATIAAEHTRRVSLRGAGHMFSTLLPHTHSTVDGKGVTTGSMADTQRVTNVPSNAGDVKDTTVSK